MANEKTADMLYCRILENKLAAQPGRLLAASSLLTQNTAENLTAPEVTCFLEPQGNSVYLYSLEVLPELRNKHLGTAFFICPPSQLAKKGFKTIKLQVSSENLPAMALYKKDRVLHYANPVFL